MARRRSFPPPTTRETIAKARADAGVSPVASLNALIRTRNDNWENVATGLGSIFGDKTRATSMRTCVVDYTTGLDLWRGDALAKKVVERLPADEVRAGFELQIQDGSDGAKEQAEEITDDWRRLKVIKRGRECREHERATGGAAAWFGVVDNRTQDQPLNEKAIREFLWIKKLECRDLTPGRWYTDPFHEKHGQPETWIYTPVTEGGAPSPRIEIHETRLYVFPGSRRTMHGSDGVAWGWGDNVFTPLIRALSGYNMAYVSTDSLLADFAQAVMKIEDLDMILNAEDADAFRERVRLMGYTRSVANTVVIGKGEEFERTTTPMAGFADALDRVRDHFAAQTPYPVAILFSNDTPGKLGGKDDAFKGYYDVVAASARDNFIPYLERVTHLLFMFRKRQAPKRWCIEPKPLHQPSAKEVAETRFITAQTDEKYFAMGAVSPQEIRNSRFGGDGYSAETVIDESQEAESLDEAREAEQAMTEAALEASKAKAAPPGKKPAERDA